jgi:hypothetical protein
MTNEQIEKIIRLMGFTAMDPYKFARAVEQAAYEAAAQECEKRAGPIEIYNRAYPHYLECAEAIRSLMTKEQSK